MPTLATRRSARPQVFSPSRRPHRMPSWNGIAFTPAGFSSTGAQFRNQFPAKKSQKYSKGHWAGNSVGKWAACCLGLVWATVNQVDKAVSKIGRTLGG
jgi:hypothetical protein